jgi:hypothetical protein
MGSEAIETYRAFPPVGQEEEIEVVALGDRVVVEAILVAVGGPPLLGALSAEVAS